MKKSMENNLEPLVESIVEKYMKTRTPNLNAQDIMNPSWFNMHLQELEALRHMAKGRSAGSPDYNAELEIKRLYKKIETLTKEVLLLREPERLLKMSIESFRLGEQNE